MTLQELKYVIAISNCKSITAAAKSLYISQSTLSSAIKELENELGITVFTRNNRGVSLTYDGADLLKYSREIVEQAEFLKQRYQHRKYLPTRFSVSTQRLPFAVRAFNKFIDAEDLTNYDLAIRECPTYAVIHDVTTNKSEVGVIAIHDKHIQMIQKTLAFNDITFHEITQMPTYIFLRKNHPLANHHTLSSEDLKDYGFVTYDQEIDKSQYTEEIIYYEFLDKNIHVSDRCTKIALVRGSDCFSIGPDLTNSNADTFHSGLGEIKAIKIKEPIEPLHVGYIVRNSTPLTELANKYLEYLKTDIMIIVD